MLTKLKWIFGLCALCDGLRGFCIIICPSATSSGSPGTEVLRKDFSGWTRVFYAKPDTRAMRCRSTGTCGCSIRCSSNGKVSVYRNEDTGFGWPPLFQVGQLKLYRLRPKMRFPIGTEPEWYVVRHYGWRNTFLSIYPNAVSIKPISGPNVQLIPWLNIIFLTVLAAFLWAIYVRVRGFWSRRISPIIENIEAQPLKNLSVGLVAGSEINRASSRYIITRRKESK